MTTELILVALLAAASAEPSNSDVPSPAPATTQVLADPVWKSRPADDELWKFYPDRAYREGIDGFAVVACVIDGSGALRLCRIDGEQPKREGFGFVLTKLAERMQAELTSASGLPTPGRVVRIGAHFRQVPLDPHIRAPYQPWGSSDAWERSRSVTIDLVTIQK
jgi:hypothetical protein